MPVLISLKMERPMSNFGAISDEICPVNGKTHVECLKLSLVTFSLYMERPMSNAWSYLWWHFHCIWKDPCQMPGAIFGDIFTVYGKTHVKCLELSLVTFSLYMERPMSNAWSYLWWHFHCIWKDPCQMPGAICDDISLYMERPMSNTWSYLWLIWARAYYLFRI